MRTKFIVLASVATCVLASTTAYAATGTAGVAKEEYTEFEQREASPTLIGDLPGAPVDPSVSGTELQHYSGAQVVKGFQGISQYDVQPLGRGFIPPDTMGAVGASQYTTFANGGFAVYDKATGARTAFTTDLDFWSRVGQTGANGDSRVMYNSAANRWIALSFGASVSDIQIAVSNTSDANGAWKSTKFTGFLGGTADYPTLAMDTNAVYIGTNNFSGSGSFAGTRLNIIPLTSLFNGVAPTTTGRQTVTTPYPSTADGGFAIQGVNNLTASSTGKVVAASLFFNDTLTRDVNFSGGTVTSVTPIQYLGTKDYDGNGAGRQPNATPDVFTLAHTSADPASNDRVIDTSDSRIGSSVYEVNGRIYFVYTATDVGSDFTSVRYVVYDAATNKLLSEGSIGDGSHDYYEGSLAVNSFGQVLIGYNRSGSGADGKVSFLVQSFSTDPNGHLTARGSEVLLKVSDVDDYHNGSVDGQVAVGRQRWGDYSAVSLDPTNERVFWAIGEYAREYNDGPLHPGGTGGSRWSTWISQINVGTNVPEPATWAMMIAGFGFVGAAQRRRRTGYTTA